MYTGGKLGTIDDIAHLIRNFRFFFSILIVDFDKSEAWKAIAQYEAVLNSKDGSRWAHKAASQNQVGLNLFIELQMILSNFLAIGNDMKLVKALREGAPIDPLNYQEACEFAASATLVVTRTARSHTLTGFDHIPTAETLFPQLGLQGDVKPAASPATPSAPQRAAKRVTPIQQGGGGNNEPRNKRVAGAHEQPHVEREPLNEAALASIEIAKQKGFLTWDSDTKKLPSCRIFVKMGTMTNKERICMQFVTIGGYCKYKKKCKCAHVLSFAALPETVQKEFADFVEKTPGLAFLPNSGPPGTD
jgi:hypothetical protein